MSGNIECQKLCIFLTLFLIFVHTVRTELSVRNRKPNEITTVKAVVFISVIKSKSVAAEGKSSLWLTVNRNEPSLFSQKKHESNRTFSKYWWLLFFYFPVTMHFQSFAIDARRFR